MKNETAQAKHTSADLKALQAYPFASKVGRTQARILEWYHKHDGNVYVSFSGGKDSAVLADLCARECAVSGRELHLMFIDTGLEYPEIRDFVYFFANWLRETYDISVDLAVQKPLRSFIKVIQINGYPLISKEVSHIVHGARLGQESCLRKLNGEKLNNAGEKSRFNCTKHKHMVDAPFDISDECCRIMKKRPAQRYEKRTGYKLMTAEMTHESALRQTQWLRYGCNGFNRTRPKSTPMAFWYTQDVLRYIRMTGMPMCSVYGAIVESAVQGSLFDDYQLLETTGLDRTGCIFCGFGLQQEIAKGEPTRFDKLAVTHPERHELCMKEPTVIEKATGRPPSTLPPTYRMEWCRQKRLAIGNKEFDKQYTVANGLGMAAVLEYMSNVNAPPRTEAMQI